MKTTLRLLGCIMMAGLLGGCVVDASPVGDGVNDVELEEATGVPPIGPVIPCAACNGSLDGATGQVLYTIPNSVLPGPTQGEVQVEPIGDGYIRIYTDTLVPGGSMLFVPMEDETVSSAKISFTGTNGNRYSFALTILSADF